MWKWIKKIFIKPKPEAKIEKIFISEEEQDNEIKEIILLQDDICRKHHG